jgi:hypothetical protein
MLCLFAPGGRIGRKIAQSLSRESVKPISKFARDQGTNVVEKERHQPKRVNAWLCEE